MVRRVSQKCQGEGGQEEIQCWRRGEWTNSLLNLSKINVKGLKVGEGEVRKTLYFHFKWNMPKATFLLFYTAVQMYW